MNSHTTSRIRTYYVCAYFECDAFIAPPPSSPSLPPLARGVKVTLENRGEVETSYSLVKPDTLFGPKFTFTPHEGILQPGGLQAIEVSSLGRVPECQQSTHSLTVH